MFNVLVPLNEARFHRLNTTLLAMVEIAEDQAAGARTDKAVVGTSTCVRNIGAIVRQSRFLTRRLVLNLLKLAQQLAESSRTEVIHTIYFFS